MVPVHFGGGIFQMKEKIKRNASVETLLFLSSNLDQIIGKTNLINELLEEESDPLVIQKLEEKLTLLEKEVEYIGKKIQVEKNIINKERK